MVVKITRIIYQKFEIIVTMIIFPVKVFSQYQSSIIFSYLTIKLEHCEKSFERTKKTTYPNFHPYISSIFTNVLRFLHLKKNYSFTLLSSYCLTQCFLMEKINIKYFVGHFVQGTRNSMLYKTKRSFIKHGVSKISISQPNLKEKSNLYLIQFNKYFDLMMKNIPSHLHFLYRQLSDH